MAASNVFTIKSEQLISSPSVFLPSLSRSARQNPYGSARVAALAHYGDSVYAVHYVYPDAGLFNTVSEFNAFNNQTAMISNVRRSYIFAGENYASVLAELDAHCEDTDSKQVYYGQAYRQFQMPVHLLSCDDTGAMQLKVMSVPNYRSVFTREALGADFVPPPKDALAWDALYDGVPFVMAADMDLRRVDAAYQLALDRGYQAIAIASLDAQADEILVPRYQDTGKAEVFAIDDGILNSVLGDRAQLYVPPPTQYLTEKGEVVYAPSIKAAGKAGGYHHK